MEDDKLKELQDLLKILESGEEILQPNLEEIYKLATENEKPPKEFEETFKKRIRDLL